MSNTETIAPAGAPNSFPVSHITAGYALVVKGVVIAVPLPIEIKAPGREKTNELLEFASLNCDNNVVLTE